MSRGLRPNVELISKRDESATLEDSVVSTDGYTDIWERTATELLKGYAMALLMTCL